MYERLLANSRTLDGQNENGCWEWTGSLNTANYGAFSKRVPGRRTPKTMLAHREMERIYRDAEAQRVFDLTQPGDWWSTPLIDIVAPAMHADDETTDHTCCLRRCVNIDHWNHVTRAENTALMQQRRKTA